MSYIKVATIAGSLREDAFSKKLYIALKERAPHNVKLTLLDFSKLPLFNEDLEASFPAEATQFKKNVKAADAILFITPEYNRSMPGVLKNAIDWGSRPYGQSSWSQKPAGIIGASFLPTGAFGAVHHLRQVLAYLDMHVLGQPEIYVPTVYERFDTNGKLVDNDIEGRIDAFWKVFIPYIQRFIL